MIFFVALVAVLGSLSSFVGAINGWDTTSKSNQTTTDCFKKANDANFIMFTGLDSGAKVDPNVCSNFQNAKNSGIPNRDVFIVPCPNCGASAAQQMSMMMDNLNANCPTLWSGRVWLNMAAHQFWTTPWQPIGWTINQKWFNDWVDACMATTGVSCGIVSSPDEWQWTLGSKTYSYAPATKLPLWYEGDETQSFDDFVPFGGFTQPYAKRFKYMTNMCTVSGVWQSYAPTWN